MKQTEFSIDGIIIPYGAGRGIQVDCKRIESGSIKRTINGTLVNLKRITHRKYSMSISCDDQLLPTFSNLWEGQIKTVIPPKKFSQTYDGGPTDFIRTPANGSVKAYNAAGSKIPFTISGNKIISNDCARFEYYPVLSMMVVSISENENEWAAKTAWNIALEEV